MEKETVKKIVERIASIVNHGEGFTRFDMDDMKICDIGFELMDGIDDKLFTALETVKKEFSVGIEICIVSNYDCNDERFYISFNDGKGVKKR